MGVLPRVLTLGFGWEPENEPDSRNGDRDVAGGSRELADFRGGAGVAIYLGSGVVLAVVIVLLIVLLV